MNSKNLAILIFSSIVVFVLLCSLFLILPSAGNYLAKGLGLQQSLSSSRVTKTGEVEEVKVQRVVDGDTIELSDGRKIRYLNMDTPETVKAGTPVMCYGPEAKEFNRREVEGKTVWLLADKENTDRYSRELRLIFLDLESADNRDANKSLNAELVRRGMAREVSYSPNTTYRKTFQQLEKQARTDKVGVWGECSNPFVS